MWRVLFLCQVAMLDPGKPAFKPVKGRSNVVMFVGLQGAGKTTTIAKFARHYARAGWKVSLLLCLRATCVALIALFGLCRWAWYAQTHFVLVHLIS